MSPEYLLDFCDRHLVLAVDHHRDLSRLSRDLIDRPASYRHKHHQNGSFPSSKNTDQGTKVMVART